MIRFRRLFNLETEWDQRRFERVRAIFRTAFPAEADAVESIRAALEDGSRLSYEPLLLLAPKQSPPV